MNLSEAVEFAAEHLPEGWRISVQVEYGAAWVVLRDDYGMSRDELADDCETTLAETVVKAVKIARRLHAEEYGKGNDESQNENLQHLRLIPTAR